MVSRWTTTRPTCKLTCKASQIDCTQAAIGLSQVYDERYPKETVKRDRWVSRQSQATAHQCNQPSGFVEIVHPFHPLFRQHFMVLKSRTVSGVECVVLKGSESGTFSVPRDWTSIRSSGHYVDAEAPPTILRLECLIELIGLVKSLSRK